MCLVKKKNILNKIAQYNKMLKPQFIGCLLIITLSVLETDAKSVVVSDKQEVKEKVSMTLYNLLDMPSDISLIKKRAIKRFLKSLNNMANDITSGNYSFGVSICDPFIQIVGLEAVESANDVNNQIQANIDKSRTNQIGLITGLAKSFSILQNFRKSDNSSLLFTFIYVGKRLESTHWPELNRLYNLISSLSNNFVYFINISGDEEIKSEFEANNYIMFDLLFISSLKENLKEEIEFVYEMTYSKSVKK